MCTHRNLWIQVPYGFIWSPGIWGGVSPCLRSILKLWDSCCWAADKYELRLSSSTENPPAEGAVSSWEKKAGERLHISNFYILDLLPHSPTPPTFLSFNRGLLFNHPNRQLMCICVCSYHWCVFGCHSAPEGTGSAAAAAAVFWPVSSSSVQCKKFSTLNLL